MRCGPVASALLLALAVVATASPIPVGLFSRATPGGPLPEGWQPVTFPSIARHTQYALVRDADGTVVLKAVADRSASGVVQKLDFALESSARLAFRWKAEGLVARGNVHDRDRDDYPVRVYVTFRYPPERLTFLDRARYRALRLIYGEDPPHAGLSYVWDARAPVGTMVPNPYTDRVRTIVVESGPARLGRWLSYERDIVADYKAAFGEVPPPIAGIGLMTDTDNTGETVVAWYGDIVLY